MSFLSFFKGGERGIPEPSLDYANKRVCFQNVISTQKQLSAEHLFNLVLSNLKRYIEETHTLSPITNRLHFSIREKCENPYLIKLTWGESIQSICESISPQDNMNVDYTADIEIEFRDGRCRYTVYAHSYCVYNMTQTIPKMYYIIDTLPSSPNNLKIISNAEAMERICIRVQSWEKVLLSCMEEDW